MRKTEEKRRVDKWRENKGRHTGGKEGEEGNKGIKEEVFTKEFMYIK